ncbi:MAG: thiamine-phosphate kinase [Deltaproteobacteria bacterium RIFCSPLOWO2_02_FULL_44_10]|nr:MAG: thiamine-phosphate kinase [Deltaproteobacteria bacterium RIFCSPHIGHO2_02_FULL_44_16]OGQ47564.1 MAG: thiamine-phosphate kinase [Deltaproteobacteria bacterium RIFCSPLOWO2_02_FULL_44_10]
MNEEHVIGLIAKGATQPASLAVGIGDDCAVIKRSGEDLLVSSDILLEEVHFRCHTTDFTSLAAKALAVNLSDIAAMGGEARFYTLSLGIPKNISIDAITSMAEGFRKTEKMYQVSLMGGDTCKSLSHLVISITVLGTVPSGEALLRSGASCGDGIYVTGPLGSSALGLRCLEKKVDHPKAHPFLRAHQLPSAQLQAGIQLRKSGMVTSMIDVSDGLFLDLERIAKASGVGFEIEVKNIPRAHNFEAVCRLCDLDPIETILTGGEDYQLCFTVDVKKSAEFEKKYSYARIGTICEQGRVVAFDEKGAMISLSHKGYDHFD